MIFSKETIKSIQSKRIPENKTIDSNCLLESLSELYDDTVYNQDHIKSNLLSMIKDTKEFFTKFFAHSFNRISAIYSSMYDKMNYINTHIDELDNIDTINIDLDIEAKSYRKEIICVELISLCFNISNTLTSIKKFSEELCSINGYSDRNAVFDAIDKEKEILENIGEESCINIDVDMFVVTRYSSLRNKYSAQAFIRDYKDIALRSKDIVKLLDNHIDRKLTETEDFIFSINLCDKYNDIPEIKESIDSIYSSALSIIARNIESLKKYMAIYIDSLSDRLNIDIYIANKLLEKNNDVDIVPDNEEENIIHYEMYSAIQDLLEDVEMLNSIQENAGLIYLQEAEQGALQKYLTKVTNGITKAWNLLTDKIARARDNIKKKINGKVDDVVDKYAGQDLKFKINDYPQYDLNRLDSIKVKPFVYEEMKDHLGTDKEFIATYYNNVPHDEKEHFANSIEKYCLTGTTTVQVTGDTLSQMRDYINNGYQAHKEVMKADIETLNKSNPLILQLSKTINLKPNRNPDNGKDEDKGATTNVGTGAAAPTVAIQNSAVVTEDNAPKVTFTDDPDRPDNDGNNSIIKQTAVYMSVSGGIITAKMRILRKVFMIDANTLIHAVAAPKKSKTNP